MFESKSTVGFLWCVIRGFNGISVMCAFGILDKAQYNGSVDTASHSIFKGEIGNREHRMVNGGKVWYKNHGGKDDVKPNGSAKRTCQNARYIEYKNVNHK